ncbi:Probable serine/threonine-protein kinase HSL1 [Mytilus edulis]|uniref:Probable serine/threonine-protein kinase HSL1 n=1 Tax=Mytilus edulis TaxID=6550 RepID=A0A8S3U857_MYTED|nr:Probable serine/threonine-protein kinase HSL1 [Mytilus edulis]
MAKWDLSVTRLNNVLALKEKNGGWKPDKTNLNILETKGFIIGKTIGEGKYSKVKKAFCTRTKETVAIKIIHKSRLHPGDCQKFIPRELEILRTLQHHGLGEADARRLFKQLLDIVAYLHESEICHRDIKCDNILLDRYFNVKLADFGFARTMPSNELLETNCGSYVYTAPEVMDGNHYDGVTADIWSMGICLYSMLCGRLPYRDEDIDILRCCMSEKLQFFKYVSKDGRDLIKQMLNIEPGKRPPISSIYKHRWMCKPLKGTGDSSVSAMAMKAVTENHVEIDPSAEHGFNCDQHKNKVRLSRVKDVLSAVAAVHGTGTSSVDLTKIPQIPVDSAAAFTGVAGPVGKKLSEQLMTITEGSALDTTPKQRPIIGGKKFSNAVKTLNKFKNAAKVVTAMNRFRRGPLNSILKMPQEKALHIIVEKHIENTEHDKKLLHSCLGGKVAKQCLQQKQEKYEIQMRPVREQIEKVKEEIEKKDLLFSTVGHLIPDEASSNNK